MFNHDCKHGTPAEASPRISCKHEKLEHREEHFTELSKATNGFKQKTSHFALALIIPLSTLSNFQAAFPARKYENLLLCPMETTSLGYYTS